MSYHHALAGPRGGSGRPRGRPPGPRWGGGGRRHHGGWRGPRFYGYPHGFPYVETYYINGYDPTYEPAPEYRVVCPSGFVMVRGIEAAAATARELAKNQPCKIFEGPRLIATLRG